MLDWILGAAILNSLFNSKERKAARAMREATNHLDEIQEQQKNIVAELHKGNEQRESVCKSEDYQENIPPERIIKKSIRLMCENGTEIEIDLGSVLLFYSDGDFFWVVMKRKQGSRKPFKLSKQRGEKVESILGVHPDMFRLSEYRVIFCILEIEKIIEDVEGDFFRVKLYGYDGEIGISRNEYKQLQKRLNNCGCKVA